VSSVRRGVYQLTDRGRSVVASKPGRVDVAYLAKFPEFEEFRRKAENETEGVENPPKSDAGSGIVAAAPTSTPQESLDAAYHQLRRAVETELLAAVRGASFRSFERLVVELLVKMGYGAFPRRADSSPSSSCFAPRWKARSSTCWSSSAC
jgi:restriction system protein